MQNVSIDVEITDTGIENVIGQNLEALFDDATMTKIHLLFAAKCDPYVPYLTGDLSRTLRVNQDGVTYTQKYAVKQYYGVGFRHNLETHPLATALWDKVMLQNEGDSFIDGIKEIVIRRAKELYG